MNGFLGMTNMKRVKQKSHKRKTHMPFYGSNLYFNYIIQSLNL